MFTICFVPQIYLQIIKEILVCANSDGSNQSLITKIKITSNKSSKWKDRIYLKTCSSKKCFSHTMFILSIPSFRILSTARSQVTTLIIIFRQLLLLSSFPVGTSGPRAAATSKMERFVIIVNGFQSTSSWMLQQFQIRL